MVEECEGCGKMLNISESDTFPYCHKCDKESFNNAEELYNSIEKELKGEIDW